MFLSLRFRTESQHAKRLQRSRNGRRGRGPPVPLLLLLGVALRVDVHAGPAGRQELARSGTLRGREVKLGVNIVFIKIFKTASTTVSGALRLVCTHHGLSGCRSADCSVRAGLPASASAATPSDQRSETGSTAPPVSRESRSAAARSASVDAARFEPLSTSSVAGLEPVVGAPTAANRNIYVV